MTRSSALLCVTLASAQAWAQDAQPEPAPQPETTSAPQPSPTPQRAAPPAASALGDPIRVGVHGNGAKMTLDFGDFFDLGFGFGARGGYELRLGDVLITPEIMINWNTFPVSDPSVGGSLWVLGVLAGARAAYALGDLIPWVAFHAGLDHADGGGTAGEVFNELGIEGGGCVELSLGSGIRVGPFGSYSYDFHSDGTVTAPIAWISFGVEGSFGL